MKSGILRAAVLAGAVLLAGCGGDERSTVASPQNRASLLPAAFVAGQFAPAAYSDAVQQLYIAYFGRPADTSGLANFESALSQAGAPTTVADISAAYTTNSTIKSLVDAFGTSAESNALYTGGTSSFVTAVYRNIFNRDPDAGGLAFWTSAIDTYTQTNGTAGLSKGNAALSIMAGALSNTSTQGLIDAQIVAKKTAVGTNFTTALASASVNGYSGDAAAATARSMLASVTDTTDTSAFQATVNSTIATLAASVNTTPSFATVKAIIVQRCVPCHSADPTMVASAPLGITFDSETSIRSRAALIYQVAVQSTLMPYQNQTGMTTDERNTIGKWFVAGAP